LVSAQLSVNLLRYTKAQGQAFYRTVLERVQALPGVESAAVARVAPLSGAGRVVGLQIEGREGARDRLLSEGGGVSARGRESVNANVVGPGYFRTLGLPLRAGRDFEERDAAGAPLVVAVNDAFVRLHFPDQ